MGESVFPTRPELAVPPTDDPLVFHYASASAALGLITNREVWGSKIQFLNDDQEFREYLNFLVRMAEDNIIVDEVSQTFCDALTERVDRIREASIYVASFSEEEDRLSQWRGYCPDGGYAIGFRRSILESHFRKNGFYFCKAVYGLPSKDEIVKSLRDLFESYRRSAPDPRDVEGIDRFFSEYIISITSAAPTFKHIGFREENEWRVFSGLTSWDHSEVDVVQVRGALRPIFRFRLPEFRVDKTIDIGLGVIRVGPGKDADLRLDAIRILLRRRGVFYQHLVKSSLPYNAR